MVYPSGINTHTSKGLLTSSKQDFKSHLCQSNLPPEPPKFSTKSPIEIEEKPNSDEPLEWYLLGLRYMYAVTTTVFIMVICLRGNTTLVHMRNADFLLFLR